MPINSPLLRYDVVDVFARAPFAGNQLAVVHEAQGLSDAQLLAITREFNFSEVTFPSRVAPGSYQVRIFTPGGEIAFAGHPTLGTAWVLRQAGALTDEHVIQECGIGPVQVRFEDSLTSLTVQSRDLIPTPTDALAVMVADLGLEPDDVVGTSLLAGAGLTFAHIPVRPDAVARALIPSTPLSAYGSLVGPNALVHTQDELGGIDVYAVTGRGDNGVEVHARVFCPGLAVPEDPATGSSAAGLGMCLVAGGILPQGGDYRISQGTELGRPAELRGSITVDGAGEATRISVGGQVHQVAGGTIRIPADSPAS